MHHFIHRPLVAANPSLLRAALALALLAAPLGACNDPSATPVERAAWCTPRSCSRRMAMLP